MNGTDHQVAGVISPLSKRTVRRLWCIRLFVLLSVLMRVALDVIPCKLESRLNVFVFIPTVAQFVDYSENIRLNPAPFF